MQKNFAKRWGGNMIDEFYEFLDQRSLVEAFEGYRQCPLSSDINPKLYLFSVDWPNTKEGRNFWAELNVEWNDYLKYWEQDLGKEWYLKGEYNGNNI